MVVVDIFFSNIYASVLFLNEKCDQTIFFVAFRKLLVKYLSTQM